MFIGQSESTSPVEEAGSISIKTGDSSNAGSIILEAGVSQIGDLDYYGAAVEIKAGSCVEYFYG